MILAILLSLSLNQISAEAESISSFKKSDDCEICKELDMLVGQFSTQTKSDDKLQTALKIASSIGKISLKAKPELQKRQIYYAINATVEVLPVDFDSESVVRLMDLRSKAPKTFDTIFHHFPEKNQKEIFDRMKALKEDRIRPKATLPRVHSEDP